MFLRRRLLKLKFLVIFQHSCCPSEGTLNGMSVSAYILAFRYILAMSFSSTSALFCSALGRVVTSIMVCALPPSGCATACVERMMADKCNRRPRLTRLVQSFLPGRLFPVVRPAGGVLGRRKDGKEAGSRISAAGRRGEVQAADPGGAATGIRAGQDRPLPLATGGLGAQRGRAQILRPYRRLRRWRGRRSGHRGVSITDCWSKKSEHFDKSIELIDRCVPANLKSHLDMLFLGLFI